jgi:predicted NAD/FAD-dependent oxidoreductase
VEQRIAVIGAGIAGLSAARTLTDGGYEVLTFEKSRGLGGRSATRRVRESSFDHGAQFFTVRGSRLRSIIGPLIDDGQVAIWQAGIVTLRSDGTLGAAPDSDRYVGVPGMSALGHALAAGLRVIRDTRIESVQTGPAGGWIAITGDGESHGPYAGLIITCPPPQAYHLLAPAAPGLAAHCHSAAMQPCWAVMAAFDTPLDPGFDAAFVEDGCLAWVSRDSSKPGRPETPDCWTLHATPEWSARHLEEHGERVAATLLDRLFQLTGVNRREAGTLLAHRWRYARPWAGTPPGVRCDETAGIVVAGDWTAGTRIEDAFLSGIRAAELMIELLGTDGG